MTCNHLSQNGRITQVRESLMKGIPSTADLSEGCRVVARFACPAEVSLMGVIARVTGGAGSGKRYLCDVLLPVA